jgi:Thioredoxin-like [2Fe-2S] ferredoxin
MSHSKRDRHSQDFILEGQFLGFIQEGYKLKYLRVAIAQNDYQQEYRIKLSKESRASIGTILSPNDWIQICGEQTSDRDQGETRFKACQVTKLDQNSANSPELTANRPQPSARIKLLLCHKSDCQKKGGKKLRQKLEQILSDRNLQDQVTIEKTGCLGKCSMAPNIVLMPGKQRLSGMTANAIADVIANS